MADARPPRFELRDRRPHHRTHVDMVLLDDGLEVGLVQLEDWEHQREANGGARRSEHRC